MGAPTCSFWGFCGGTSRDLQKKIEEKGEIFGWACNHDMRDRPTAITSCMAPMPWSACCALLGSVARGRGGGWVGQRLACTYGIDMRREEGGGGEGGAECGSDQ